MLIAPFTYLPTVVLPVGPHKVPPMFPVLGGLCSLTPGETRSFPQFFFN